MGGSYRQCTECGKRALSIATRCPGCGRELPAPAGPEDGLDLRRFLSPGMVVAVLAAAAIVAAAGLGRGQPREEESSSVAVGLAADSIAAYSAGAYAAVPAEAAGELFVARDWTNVRRARSTRADLEAVLTPGDSVVADSLERDWYRVALEGEVLGYVHRTTLVRPAQ
jgi:hypothetical protein